MAHESDLPQGRAYALKLPDGLTSDRPQFVDIGGICWCYWPDAGLLVPLEAVCTKVRIPGVRYPEHDQ